MNPRDLPFPGAGGTWRVNDGALVPEGSPANPPIPTAPAAPDVDASTPAPKSVTQNQKASAPRLRKHQE